MMSVYFHVIRHVTSKEQGAFFPCTMFFCYPKARVPDEDPLPLPVLNRIPKGCENLKAKGGV